VLGGQRHSPAALPPGKRPGAHCAGGWMGPIAGLDGCRKSHPPPGFNPRTVQPVATRCPSYFWARLLIRMEGMRNVWEVFIRRVPKQDRHSVNRTLTGWVWRCVGRRSATETARRPDLRHVVSAVTAVFCARFGVLGPALL
jgi:hypothetical protein